MNNIEKSAIQVIWHCKECKTETSVSQQDLAEIGGPVCPICGDDMEIKE